MNIRKLLIKLNYRLESTWQNLALPLTVSDAKVSAGWYVGEFLVQGAISHTPRIVINDDEGKEQTRTLIGFHSGRNRMLFYLPAGHITAYSQSIEFERLARVSNFEGRARVLLICFRYLVDFFSLRVLLRMIAMQFQSRAELSTDLLHFYSPAPESYLQNVQSWERFRGFGEQLAWWTRGVKIAVVIEDDSQRQALDELLVKPDWVLSADDVLPDGADFVLPLSQSEQLREPSILMLKRALRKSKQLDLVYTDHDFFLPEADGSLLNAEGSLSKADGSLSKADGSLSKAEGSLSNASQKAPVFKPQPSQAYLHCYNYIGPAVLFSASVVKDQSLTDLLDDEYRYRLALRCFENLKAVKHIPETLFISDGSDAIPTPEPTEPNSPWPSIQWQRRDNHNVLVADIKTMLCPSVDLVIPTRDGLAVLKPCIDSLLEKTTYPNFKIIIVDNGSELEETHHYFAHVQQDPRVRVVEYPGAFNYSAINNFAVAQGDSQYIALVNNDIEVIHADWLHQMMAWAQQPEVGIVGAKLLFGNGLVQHAGVTIGMGNAAGHIHRLEAGDSPGYQYRCLATQNMMAVTAACLVTPRHLFEELGGLDAEHLSVAYNDIDYCLRVEAKGLQLIWTPEARLYHHESVSRGDDMSEQHIERYFKELGVLQKRWKTKGFVDKYYSPHLRISDEGVYPQLESNASDELVVL